MIGHIIDWLTVGYRQVSRISCIYSWR
jgi:hypothetical protein